MRLLFQQRLFSWFDSYDVYDQEGNTVYTVKGQLSWGHRLQIYDARGQHLGTVQERGISLLPKFDLYLGDWLAGTLKKELTFLRPRFTLNCNGWVIQGDLWQWNYQVTEGGRTVMSLSKELWNWSDTYQMDIPRPGDALLCLMIVLAIDAGKCSWGG